MGIELPADLAGVAASAGVQWPQADEDAMRTSAQAWRQAGTRMSSVTSNADGTANKALGAVSGRTGDAARQHWNGFVTPGSGHLTSTVSGCNSAADRLDHAADQITTAKKQIIGHLVNLAKTSDAANQAAAAGHPAALLGLPTAVKGTAANVANVHQNLTRSVQLGSGTDLLAAKDPVPSGGAGGPGVSGLNLPQVPVLNTAGHAGPVTGLTNAVTGTVTPTVGSDYASVGQPGVPVAHPGGQPGPAQPGLLGPQGVVNQAVPLNVAGVAGGQPVVGQQGLVDPGAVAQPGSAGHLDLAGDGHTGPISAGTIASAGGPPADLGSGGGGYANPVPVDHGGGLVNTGGSTPPMGVTVGQSASATLAPPPPSTVDGGGGFDASAPISAAPPPASGLVSFDPGAGGGLGSAPSVGFGGGAPGGITPGGIAPGGIASTLGGSAAPAFGSAATLSPGAGPAGAAGAAGMTAVGPVGTTDGGGSAGSAGSGPAGGGAGPVGRGGSSGIGQAPGSPAAGGGASADWAAAGAGRAARSVDFVGPVDNPAAGGAQPAPVARSGADPGLAAAVGRNPGARQVLTPGRPGREIVALFLVHMFPIGHLPVASSRPTRQLPPPPTETDYAAGLRFPPHDHPRSDLIDDEIALAAREAGDPSVETGPARPDDDPAVTTLAEDHDPLGGGNDRDWDRRFLVREADSGVGLAAEYAWPPSELCPEGGWDDGEPVVLAEGTALDRFGSAEGRVFAEDGTPFAHRSLPPDQLTAGYRQYRVLRELPVWRTLSAAWFGQPGGGVRYRAGYPAADLVALGYLEEIS